MTITLAGPPNYEGWFKAKDVVTAGTLTCCALAALAPQQYWPLICRIFAGVHLRLRGPKHQRLVYACQRYLNVEPSELALQIIAAVYEENVEVMREIFPRGWKRTIMLHGSGSIDRARRQGRGAVLWVSPFAHSDLVTKRALALAGYSVSHMSHIGHPYSASWLGVRLLNSVRLRAEDRYLERRVLVDYSKAKFALDALKQVLRDNGVVTVTAIAAGRTAIALPMLGGTVRLAMGAPYLALQTGAALIPAHTVPDQCGGYCVHCGPDLNSAAAGENSEIMHQMAQRYIALLEPFVLAHPANWRGWLSIWQPPYAAAEPAAVETHRAAAQQLK